MPRWVDYIPELHKKILAQRFGPNDSQIVSAIAHPVEAINRGGEWFRHNVNQASGGDPYDNPNPIIGPTQDEQAQSGLNLAGLAQLGAMPGAPSSAGGTLGTFIGPKAATWDNDKAALAKQLLDSGVPPEQVWKEHLIGKLPGGHLFSEIDDSAAMAIPNNEWSLSNKADYRQKGNVTNSLGSFFKHDDLDSNYPGILSFDEEGNTFTGKIRRGSGDYGTFNKGNNIEVGGIESLDGTGKANKSVMLHELQHAIQDREGWPTGGSPNNTPLYDVEKLIELQAHRKSLGIDPEQIRGAIDSGQQVPIALRERLNKYDDLLRQEKEILDNKLAPIEAYRRLQGEAQARLTQDRIPLTMEQRREQYPLEGNKIADIPFNKLITRYGGSGDQRRIDLPETEFSKAHKIAQERAALPVEQGGLGLPPDNTPMDRARALGFDIDTDLYHGTSSDINKFKNNKRGINTSDITPASNIAHWTTNDPVYAEDYALYSANRNKEHPSIYQLFSRSNNPLQTTEDDLRYALSLRGGKKKLKDQMDMFGQDSLEIDSPHELGIIEPKNIRSRFAAFDPFNKDSTNILASMIAGTTLLANQEKQEKSDKNIINSMAKKGKK